jgi:ribonuclease BN (tRNA processing enzyme)
LAYLPDHAPAAGVSAALLAMLDGVDVLIHDAQFLEGERPVAVDYGHATVQDAVKLAGACGAGTLVLFHHSPTRTDTALDAIGVSSAHLSTDATVLVAREGMTLDVRRGA